MADVLSLVTAPAEEPITLAEVKRQVLQGTTVDDAYLGQDLIPAARDRCQLATGRALITQTWDWFLDREPGCGWLEIPKPPLQSVTFVKYRDTAGDLQTWASSYYVVQAAAGDRASHGRLALAYGQDWPTCYGQMGDIQIRFVAGYGLSAAVPPMLKAAMRKDVGNLYIDRDATIDEGAWIGRAYRSFRVWPTQRRVA